MNDKAAEEKWNAIYAKSSLDEDAVAKILKENAHLLPRSGYALDLACGMGSNSVFLARRGMTVDAIDISDVAINALRRYSNENTLSINASKQDLVASSIPENRYDIVFVAHYLQRDLVPVMKAALKPRGLIFYQTFTREVTASYTGPSNADFRLDSNELLHLFNDYKLVVYREEGLLGEQAEGFRNEAMIIAQKP